MEAVLGIVVLSVTMAPMMVAMQRANVDQITPVMISRARWLAVERLERVIADRHSISRGYSYIVNGNYATENPVSTDIDFIRSVSIEETDADLVSAGTGYKTITVTVQWTDATAQSRSLVISTVVTDFS
jgi:hypothetical protein